MINTLTVVGRLVSDPKIIETKNMKKAIITISVPRNFKNLNGIYEADVIDCIIWAGGAQQVCELCKKGDLIGVKGRLQSSVTIDDGTTYQETRKRELAIVAEKISFLASGKQSSNER